MMSFCQHATTSVLSQRWLLFILLFLSSWYYSWDVSFSSLWIFGDQRLFIHNYSILVHSSWSSLQYILIPYDPSIHTFLSQFFNILDPLWTLDSYIFEPVFNILDPFWTLLFIHLEPLFHTLLIPCEPSAHAFPTFLALVSHPLHPSRYPYSYHLSTPVGHSRATPSSLNLSWSCIRGTSPYFTTNPGPTHSRPNSITSPPTISLLPLTVHPSIQSSSFSPTGSNHPSRFLLTTFPFWSTTPTTPLISNLIRTLGRYIAAKLCFVFLYRI